MISGSSEETFVVAELSEEQIDPTAFAEDEVGYAYYLKHLATLANAVVMAGENRGFIDLKMWRRIGCAG